MKTKSIALTMIFLCLAYTSLNAQEIEQQILTPEEMGVDPNLYTRHKPNKFDETNNRFSTKDELIKLAIPITTDNPNFKVDRVFNISRSPFLGKHVNGILVILDGVEGQETPDKPVTNFIKVNIPFSKFQKKPLNKGKLSRDTELVVWVVHDDEIGKDDSLGQCLLDDIKKYFKKYAKSYGFKVPKKVKYKCDSLGISDFKPNEHDGDVIGGN